MSDLVEQLRTAAATHTQHCGILREAADRIEALEKALRSIMDLVDSETGEPLDDAIEIARVALAGSQDK